MSFFKGRVIENPNFIPILGITILFALTIASGYVPESFRIIMIVMGYVGFISTMFVAEYVAKVKVAAWKHILATIRLPDGTKIKRHIYLLPTTESARLKESDLSEHGMPGYWAYRLSLEKAIKIPGYSTVDEIIMISRGRFDDTFSFLPSEKWAVWMGQVTDHPAAEAATLYLYPYPHNEFQKRIPVAFVVEGGGEAYFPSMITNWPTDLPAEVVATVKERELQEQLVSREYENITLREQLKGLTKQALTVDKAVSDRVRSIGTYQDKIMRAVTPERRIHFNITWIVVAAMLAVTAYYFYVNPQAMAYVNAYFTAYTPHILVSLLMILLIVYFIRRRRV